MMSDSAQLSQAQVSIPGGRVSFTLSVARSRRARSMPHPSAPETQLGAIRVRGRGGATASSLRLSATRWHDPRTPAPYDLCASKR